MISKQIHFNSFLKENYFPDQRSVEGWTVMIGFVLLTTACFFASAAMVRIVFPVGGLVTGIFLYLRHPILYMGFSWWMWFLSALIARLVDFRVGWDPTRQILIAPYLVSFITIATLFRYLPSASRQGGLPFLLSFAGMFYATLVGMINNQPIPVARSLLDWLAPVLLGFHLFINWRDYPSYRHNIQRTFLWGVLIMGAYGVYQFVVAPEWDRYWLIQSKMFTSSGNPVPFGMRIWSTLHSLGPFGAVMQAGLLLLFTSSGPLIFPASAFGYLSFLLAQARTNWGGWLLGVILIMGSVKARIQMRLITIILVMAMCVVPLVTIEPISKVVAARFQTFSHLEEDSSFKDRSATYDRQLSIALSNIFGNGFGNSWHVNPETGQIEVIVIDSGILDAFFTLGWVGAIPYLGGLILIVVSVTKYTEARFDSFVSAARAIGISGLSQIIIGNGMISLAGLILWGFFGMAMAAHKYYQHNGITSSK